MKISRDMIGKAGLLVLHVDVCVAVSEIDFIGKTEMRHSENETSVES